MMGSVPEPVGVTELSRQIGLPVSTVQRALVTLEEAGYLQRLEGSTKYQPGPMTQYLARALYKRFSVRKASVPFLRRLTADTDETTSLAVRIGWYAIRIHVVESAKLVYHPHRLGETMLLHASLQPRAILAFLSDDEIGRYRRFVRSRYPTEAGDLDKGSFLKDVRTWRNQGYVVGPTALSGGHAIAMPLRDASGHAIASIAINGPVLTDPGKRDDRRIKRWLEVRDEFEALIRKDPDEFASPYAHRDPDEIWIRTPFRA